MSKGTKQNKSSAHQICFNTNSVLTIFCSFDTLKIIFSVINKRQLKGYFIWIHGVLHERINPKDNIYLVIFIWYCRY